MQFRAEEYFKASQERMQQAAEIYRNGHSFALAMYCGGLAVECLLRAFRWKADQTFEGRHNLTELLAESQLLTIHDDYMRRKHTSEDSICETSLSLRAAVNDIVAVLWNNNLRFASEASLKAFLKRANRLRGIKGDPLKKNALDVINAAQLVLNRGIAIWTSKTRS